MVPMLQAIATESFVMPLTTTIAPPIVAKNGLGGFASTLEAVQNATQSEAQTRAQSTEPLPGADSGKGLGTNTQSAVLSIQSNAHGADASQSQTALAAHTQFWPQTNQSAAVREKQIQKLPATAPQTVLLKVAPQPTVVPSQAPVTPSPSVEPLPLAAAAPAVPPNGAMPLSVSTSAGLFPGVSQASSQPGNVPTTQNSTSQTALTKMIASPNRSNSINPKPQSTLNTVSEIAAVSPTSPADVNNSAHRSAAPSSFENVPLSVRDQAQPDEPPMETSAISPPAVLLPPIEASPDLTASGTNADAGTTLPRAFLATTSVNATPSPASSSAAANAASAGRAIDYEPIAPATQLPAENSDPQDAGKQTQPTSLFNSFAPAVAGNLAAQVTTMSSMPAAVPAAAHAKAQDIAQSSAPAKPLPASPVQNGSAQAAAPTEMTPFSVFFSDSAGATDSAASVLPKMILPASGISVRFGRSGRSASAGETQQSSGAQSANKQNGVVEGSTSLVNRPQTAATANGSEQNAQATHTSSDSTAAAEVVQPSGPPAQAPTPLPIAVGAAIPVAAQAAFAPTAQPTQTPPPPASSGATQTPATLPEPAVPGPVQAAQIVDRAGQSEMRIGLTTTAFGNVEVHTVVRTSEVGLVIGSEKGDLHALLANDLPAIANNLQQQNLRLNSVNFTQGYTFSGNNPGGGSSQQRSYAPVQMPQDTNPHENTSDETTESSVSAAWSSGGLSILA
jgi:hypothetical protein